MRRMHPGKVLAAASLYLLSTLALAAPYEGVIALYEANRREGIPNYVTQDVYLVAYQDLSRQELAYREQAMAATLASWLGALRLEAGERESEGEIAAGDLLDVLAALGGEAPELSDTARAELALIMAAEGLSDSTLWGAKVDYSQFAPRGRYAGEESSERYFRQVRYLNSTLFYINASKATGVTDAVASRHMAMLRALIAWGGAGEAYADLLQSTGDMGSVDDFSLADAATIEGDDLAAGLRARAEQEQRYPQVLQGYVERSALEEGETPGQALLGVRLLPGRVTADTLAMQALVNEAGAWVGEGEQPFAAAAGGTGIVKGWPTANEVLVAMGVDAAAVEVAAAGDDQFANYKQAMVDAGAAFEQRPPLKAANWALYQAVTASREDQSAALMTARALWTLQRHENLLYAKQSYTMVDRSMAPMLDRSQSSIEPAVAVYEALAQLLVARADLAPEEFTARWQAFASLLQSHTALARKLQSGEALTPEEGDQLADIDLDLKKNGIEPDEPVVVDVHTHPGEDQVLQEATAWAIVEQHDTARGARLSHREFKQPIDERLTDEAWRKKLGEQD